MAELDPIVAGSAKELKDAPAREQRRSICILSLSPIADDPRVRRHGDAFHRLGWNVIGVGLPGARSASTDWPVLTREDLESSNAAESSNVARSTDLITEGKTVLSLTTPRRGVKGLLLRQFWNARRFFMTSEANWRVLERRIKRQIGGAHQFIVSASRSLRRLLHGGLRCLPYGSLRFYLRQLRVRVLPASAEPLYWTLGSNILDLYACAQRVDADVWLANDWNTLPIAARLAAEKGGVYGYDTHEFAAEEYAEKWQWRLLQKPLVCAIERKFIAGARVVSAVSEGIAERLDQMYRLPRHSLVIRNTPAFERFAFRPTGERIKVLYHGIVSIGRGLEAAIDSVVLWRPEFDLTIRGPENGDYSEALRQRICDAGIEDRARLLPPVPMTELVKEATAFDVGFFALPGHSRHNEFALPNKFFEYLMAGLALCVSDLPEMAALVRHYRAGELISNVDPAAIAQTINSFDRKRIDECKRNALSAAEELCWEREASRFVEAYRRGAPQTAAVS